jgi:hypothetical protein
MRLELSRRLVLSLALGVALIQGTALPIAAAGVSTLTGETLIGGSTLGNTSPTRSQGCPSTTFSVSGTVADGPYPGTFTDAGTFTIPSFPPATFMGTFTITSGTATIIGQQNKTQLKWNVDFLDCGPPCGPSFRGDCPLLRAMLHTFPEGQPTQGGVPYTATIHNMPTSKDQCKGGGWQTFGDAHDEGVSSVDALVDELGSAFTREIFASSLAQAVLVPQFKNQGECVSFVEHHT